MRKTPISLVFTLIFTLILTSCNFPRATEVSEVSNNPGAIQTYAAQTVQALSTQIAQATTTPQVVASASPSQTTGATTPSASATDTVAPTTASTPATATATPLPCDMASFIEDVTIPDGTVMGPGRVFTKTWRLKNTGSCTWNSSYALVFADDGNAMSGPAALQFTTGTVAPGEEVNVSVQLTAPQTAGTYRGYWKLRNANGEEFGTGSLNKPFYVDIVVSDDIGDGPSYKLTDFYCLAAWSNASSDLECPGKTDDEEGYVLKQDSPQLENGQIDDEAALVTFPEKVNDGYIRGVFPLITVASGSKFAAVIGCQYNATDCNVKFILSYKVEGGTEQTLAEWNEKYDNAYSQVQIDLAGLAGKKVQFILTVKSNGPWEDDAAVWLAPRIIQ